MTATTTEPVTFTTTTGQYAHEDRIIPSRPLTVSEWLDTIWTGQTTGFGETHYINELARDKDLLAAVKANRVRPERIIGRGVRKPKTSAIQYLEGSIRRNEQGLRARGRSERINIENAEGYARKGHAAPGREQNEPKGPSPITPDPAAEAAALASWHGIDKADGGTYDWCRKREVTVCGRCFDYAEDSAIVWFDEARDGFIHRGNDSNRCPGQEDDGTDDRCDRSDVERVPADTISAESLDHWQRTGQYLPVGTTGVNGFEVMPVRILDGEAAHCSEAEATAWGVYVTYGNAPTMHVEDRDTREDAEQMAGKLAERFAVEARTLTDDVVDYASSASRQYWIETGRYLRHGEAESVHDEPDVDAEPYSGAGSGDDGYDEAQQQERESAARIAALDCYGMTDQPTTCPKCGTRSHYDDLPPVGEKGQYAAQHHICPACKYEFRVEADEWNDHDEDHGETPDPACDYCEPADEPQTWTFFGHWNSADELTVDHAVLGEHQDVYDPAAGGQGEAGNLWAAHGTGLTLAEAEADARAGYEHVHYVLEGSNGKPVGPGYVSLTTYHRTRDQLHADAADFRAENPAPATIIRLYAERTACGTHECECAHTEPSSAYAEGYSVGRWDTEPIEYADPWQRAEYERGITAGKAAWEATA